MPNVGRKAPDEEHTQSVVFEKSADWTEASSRKWCEDHDYYTDGLDETGTQFRWRQYDPDDEKFVYRNKEIEADSITLVLGIPKGKAKDVSIPTPATRTAARQPIRCFEGIARPHEPFWRLRNAAETGGEPEMELYGYISEYSWFDDDVTPKLFKDDLYRLGGGGPITVRINSQGGDVVAASVIRSIMLDYPGQITTRIDGLAASAAVGVAIAGKRVRIQDSAYMMIHDPGISVFLAYLDIELLGSLLAELKVIKSGITDAYAGRTGLNPERLSKMMRDETWMSATEAVALGFADEVIEGPKPAPSQLQDAAIVNALRSYVHVPAALAALFSPPAINPIGQPVGEVDDDPAALAKKQAADRLRAEVRILR